jgi:proteasome lid subunit RPN8/RPN11
MGSPKNHFRIQTQKFLKFGQIRRKISLWYHTGIHVKIIVVRESSEISVESDLKTIDDLGLKDSNEITFSFSTPAIPIFSVKYKKIIGIDVSQSVISDCLEHANSNSSIEVSGILIGKDGDGRGVKIEKSLPISSGDNVSVNLDPLMVARIAEELRKKDTHIVGWYHSHTRSAEPSTIDLRLQTAYQMMYPHCIAMIIDNIKQSTMFFQSSYLQTVKYPLNNSVPKFITMESESVTLLTTIAKKESVAITSLTIKDILTGQDAILNINIKNTGTAKVENLILVSSWVSSNNNVLHTSSKPFSLEISETKSLTVKENIPLHWPDGIVSVRTHIKKVDSDDWIQRNHLTTFAIMQHPIYDIKIKVANPEQEILPGQTAFYVVIVKNNGNRRDCIEINYHINDSENVWNVSVLVKNTEKKVPFKVELSAGETKRIMMKVKGPEIGTAGAHCALLFSAISLGGVNTEGQIKNQ